MEACQTESKTFQLLATSKCCCDLLRAPVPRCWSRRAGDLRSIPSNQACLAPPSASQIMASPLRASACAPLNYAIWQTCFASGQSDIIRLNVQTEFFRVGCRYMTNHAVHLWRKLIFSPLDTLFLNQLPDCAALNCFLLSWHQLCHDRIQQIKYHSMKILKIFQIQELYKWIIQEILVILKIG